MIATFNTLPSGVSLRLKYDIDSSGTWTYSEATTSGNYMVMPVDKRFLNISFGMDGTVGATTPEIISIHMFFDKLMRERPIG